MNPDAIATEFVETRANGKTLQELLGHNTLTTKLETHAHVAWGTTRQAMAGRRTKRVPKARSTW